MGKVTFLDFFSGIGGFRMGFENAGMKCMGHVEWDKYAQRSYKAIYGDREGYDGEYCGWDIREVRAADLPRTDVWTFGAPCQDFSIAGQRKGMDGDRSSLIREVFRLIEESEHKPEWLVYENVKGMLSSNRGWDFFGILFEMDRLGYDIEWQIFNSKDWGVPQNRERVYTIGHKRGSESKHIFPIIGGIPSGNEIEKVYHVSCGISSDVGIFLESLQQADGEKLSQWEVQELLKNISQSIEREESTELHDYESQVCNIPEGGVQQIENIGSWTPGVDYDGGICGVVSIPTEEMLLLWLGRNEVEDGGGCFQQQNIQTFNRPRGFIERVRKGELSSMLLAVQQYQERLFYSIGDGANWEIVCIKEVGGKSTLASILEAEVDEKYYLSQDKVDKLIQT